MTACPTACNAWLSHTDIHIVTVHGNILVNHTGNSYWRGKIWRISYKPNTLSVYLWILVGKILVNSSRFVKFVNFPHQNFPMYAYGKFMGKDTCDILGYYQIHSYIAMHHILHIDRQTDR